MSQEGRRTHYLQKEIGRKSADQPLGGIATCPSLYGTKKKMKSQGHLTSEKMLATFNDCKKWTIKNMEHNMECSVVGRIILGCRSVIKRVQKSDNESDFLSVKKTRQSLSERKADPRARHRTPNWNMRPDP